MVPTPKKAWLYESGVLSCPWRQSGPWFANLVGLEPGRKARQVVRTSLSHRHTTVELLSQKERTATLSLVRESYQKTQGLCEPTGCSPELMMHCWSIPDLNHYHQGPREESLSSLY